MHAPATTIRRRDRAVRSLASFLGLFCLLPILSGCGLAFAKASFLDATAEGKLKRGQTVEEVRALVGNPDSTKSTVANDIPVEVWTYRQTSQKDKEFYIGVTGITFGIVTAFGLMPVGATEEHYIVFADGRVLSWDSPPQVGAKQAKAKTPPPAQSSDEGPQAITAREVVTGTGFSIGQGYFFTNYHVVAGVTNVTLHHQGEEIAATVALRDQANDLALLKASKDFTKKMGMRLEGPLALDGLRLGDASKVKQGDRVWTLGFPLAAVLGEKPVLSEGAISSLYGPGEDPRLLQISAPIQPGNSGGPLLNSQGEVIGITMSTLDALQIFKITGAVPQNVNFAVKINYAKSLVSMLPNSEVFEAAVSHTKSPVELSALADMARPHVVLIKASR